MTHTIGLDIDVSILGTTSIDFSYLGAIVLQRLSPKCGHVPTKNLPIDGFGHTQMRAPLR